MKKAIIIGSSSGIGRALAKVLAAEGFCLGLAARRTDLLEELGQELNTPTHIRVIDLAKQAQAMLNLNGLIEAMNGVDLIIISSGTGYLNDGLEWEKEKETIDVNVSGFTALVNVSLHYFLKKGEGTLAAISSIAAIRGSAIAPSYNASKSFVSNYLEGIRCKIKKLKTNINIIDIQPGFVATDMAKGEGLFWVASPEKAAWQIYRNIKRGKEKAYVTKRWALIAWVLRFIPDWLYHKL